MARKRSFRLHMKKVAAGDATDKLYYPQREYVPSATRHHITLLTFEDETSTPTEVQISAGPPGAIERLGEQVSPQAGRSYWWPHEIVLTSGEQLEVYFSGATASDILHLWVQGYWIEVE